MKEITVTTQAELDALPAKFDEYTLIIIKGGTANNRISVNKARENSSVEARGNSSVVAWGNSSVFACGNCGVHLQSNSSSVSLYAFAVCWVLAKGKVQKKSKTATIIRPT